MLKKCAWTHADLARLSHTRNLSNWLQKCASVVQRHISSGSATRLSCRDRARVNQAKMLKLKLDSSSGDDWAGPWSSASLNRQS